MNKPQKPLERVALLCHNTILDRIWTGADYGARAYIYRLKTISDMELSSPQCLLLALLHSLVTEEIMSCCVLADICHQVEQLQSDHLRVWITGDFVFPRQDIEKAMVLLSKLLNTGVLKLPSHVIRIMSSLATKYRIHGAQLLSPLVENEGDLASQLEDAVADNRPGDIIFLANKGSDVNRLTQSGDSLIHLATRAGCCDSIAALGFLKVDLEFENSSNATPLEEAVESNSSHSIKALLMAGAKVDKRLFRGDTYLHIAAAGSQNRALEALLEGGMDVNDTNHFGETPLIRAIRAGNVQGMKMLLEKGTDASIVPEGGMSLPEMVLESKNPDMLQAFVKNRADIKSQDGNTILHFLASSGNFEMLDLIKNQRLPRNIKNHDGQTPLHVASDPSIVRLLIKMGEDVNIQDNNGSTALMIAAKNSMWDIVTLLLYKGANPKIKDKEGRTPLHYAAEGGCIGSVTTLLDAGARVDDVDNKGDTPAFLAALNNKSTLLQLLVERGADVALKNSNGNGILHCAARCGHVEVVAVLLDANVPVDMEAQDKATALHYAARNGHPHVVTLLLDNWADPGSKTESGWTPLMLASQEGHFRVVQLLVDRDAPVNDRTNDGSTALGCANDNGHREIAEYLRSKGGVQLSEIRRRRRPMISLMRAVSVNNS